VGDWQVQSQEFEGRKERERRKEGRDTTEGWAGGLRVWEQSRLYSETLPQNKPTKKKWTLKLECGWFAAFWGPNTSNLKLAETTVGRGSGSSEEGW
jgi:hypothetical protein